MLDAVSIASPQDYFEMNPQENSVMVPKTLNIESPRDPAMPLLGKEQKELKGGS